jgi:Rod binding domain-containing protein
MIDILRFSVTKEHLLKMTKEERTLFLLLGYASNQVNALWKLVIVLANDTQDDPVKQRLEGAQTQIFVRLTIGAMREALKLVEKLFVQSTLGKEFVPLLDQQASASLERLSA